nr:conserved hypothetical protein [Ipomoea batatas]
MFSPFHDSHEGTLKWKSHEMTKAKTMQASKKLRNRWPCQKLRASAGGVGAVSVVTAAVLPSLHCSAGSASLIPTTLCATDPQISQVLQMGKIYQR